MRSGGLNFIREYNDANVKYFKDMRKITKSDIKKIKAGSHDTLIDAIEFLIDSYDEDKFEAGYKCRIEDEAIVAHKLADTIGAYYQKNGLTVTLDKKSTKGNIVLDTDDLAKVIEKYYTNALKDK
jgi:hydrogenase maturation factor HypF (carbamoyltransferase family)